MCDMSRMRSNSIYVYNLLYCIQYRAMFYYTENRLTHLNTMGPTEFMDVLC